MITTFLPILISAVIAFLLAVVMVVIAWIIGPKRINPHRVEPYECGIVPEKRISERFDIRYYVIAILFIAFDVEIIFLFPWAVAFDKLGIFAFIEMLIFFLILLVAYIYAWRNGIFDWGASPDQRV